MIKLYKIFSKKTPTYGQEVIAKARNSSDEKLNFYFYEFAARLPISFQKILFFWEIIRNAIDPESTTFLDVGCGKGVFMHYLKRNNKNKYYSIGIDIFELYIEFCRSKNIYNELYRYDIRNLSNLKVDRIDTVLCLDVIEHLTKEEGLKLISDLESLADRQVIISTPVGFHRIKFYDDNPSQFHRSGWTPKEFRNMGYIVRGVTGLRWLRGERAGSLFQSPILKIFNAVLLYLSQPFVYFIPEVAWGMVCIKNLKQKECQRR